MIELKTAKYKGVEFLYEELETSGGNRNVGFTFPGSDKQAIETQGKVPRKFVLRCIIPHDGYYQKRDDLIRVLEDGEKGVLSHPTFGDIPNVANGVWTLNERISELGRGSIEIEFDVDDAPGIPTQSANLPSQVQQQVEILNNQAAQDLAKKYNVSLNFAQNYLDALETGQRIADKFAAASEVAAKEAEKAAKYQAAVNAFSNKIGDLMQNPLELANGTKDLFDDLNGLYDTPLNALAAMYVMLGYGSDDPEIMETTVEREERKRNRDLLRANMRTQALGFAYINASQVDYESTADVDAAQDKLEAAYVDIRENQLISNEALEQLDRVRVQFHKTADNIAVNTKSIITIYTDRKPLSVLLYEYYGNTDLFDTIAELNGITQNAFVEGDIKLLTA